MASDAQINANRRNALRSTGPTSPQGRARSAMNSRKHAIRSEQEKLGRDESISYQSRFIRWTGNYAPKSDPEEFLVHANLFVGIRDGPAPEARVLQTTLRTRSIRPRTLRLKTCTTWATCCFPIREECRLRCMAPVDLT